MQIVLVLASALPALAGTFPIITSGSEVSCHSGPGASYPTQRSYASGSQVDVTCQVAVGSSIWDKTSDGCYVPGASVSTGHSFVSQCAPDSHCTHLNELGMDLIKRVEGFEASPSPDPVGLPTVGYGHHCSEHACTDLNAAFPLSPSAANQLLQDDLTAHTLCLAQSLGPDVHLNDNQWAALASWVLNQGCEAAQSSTLVKRLNAGEKPDMVAASELPKWRHGVDGTELPGLVRRRAAEVELFKTASSRPAFPNCQALVTMS